MRVEDFPDLGRKVGEVAAVQTYAVSVRIIIVNTVLLERPDGIEYAAPEGVVGVDEENQVLAPVGVDVVAESLVLAFDRASV